MAVLLGLALCAVACGPPRPLTPQVSYDYFCARCHGDDGTGDPRTVGLNPKLDLLTSDMIESRDGTAIRQRIVQGEGAMPGFREKLEPHEIDELVAYTLERFGPKAPNAPGAPSTATAEPAAESEPGQASEGSEGAAGSAAPAGTAPPDQR